MRIFSTLLLAAVLPLAVAADDTTITYQGQLQQQGEPFSGTLEMVFTLFEQADGGSPVGSPIVKDSVPVSDGLFKVDLDFGHAYQGERWLEIVVDGVELAGRQRIAPAPTAVFALNVPDSLASVWEQDGDAISYWASGQGMGIEPDSEVTEGARIVMGRAENQAGGIGATVSGGGTQSEPNIAAGDYTTVGGGKGNVTDGGAVGGNTIGGGLNNTTGFNTNTISGGRDNYAGPNSSTVAGGRENEATGWYATIGGGYENAASGDRAVIGGGQGNQAGGFAVVGGGLSNSATGSGSMVPGGVANEAVGQTSFAAGNRAKANHDGTFVWADSQNSDFSSSDNRQFLVRASGGMGINTNDPQASLHVHGNAAVGGLAHDYRLGVGTDNPWVTLHVVSNAEQGPFRAMVENNNSSSTAIRAYSHQGVAIGHSWTDSGVPERGLRTHGDLWVDDFARFAYKVGYGDEPCWSSSTDDSGRHYLGHCGSSIRFKDTVETLQSALEMVEQLRPVRFDIKETGKPDIGLIAEEVLEIIPEIVTFNPEGQVQGLKYNRLGAIMIAAFQEQRRIDDQQWSLLEAENAGLQAKVSDLAAENTRLENKLEELTEVVGTREQNLVRRLADRNDELEQRLAALESLLLEDRAVASER